MSSAAFVVGLSGRSIAFRSQPCFRVPGAICSRSLRSRVRGGAGQASVVTPQRPGPVMCAKVSAPCTGHLSRLDADDQVRERFGVAVKGEWPGFSADFDPETGEALVISNLYIPEEFVEWDMFPVGFETNNSAILRGTRFFQKKFRLLPNVSVFGDHVDIEEDLSIIDVAEELGFRAAACGTFSSGASSVIVDRKSILQKWPQAELAIRSEGHAVRAVFTFDFAKGEFVEPVSVTVERWECVYCDGGNIDGSSGYVGGWASDEAMRPEDLSGTWTSSNPDTPRITRENGAPPLESRKQLYLPSGIDVGIEKLPDGSVSLHMGRLVEGGKRYILTRSYKPDGTLANCYYATETREE